MKQLLISFFLLVTLPILGRGQTAADSITVVAQIDSLIELSIKQSGQGHFSEALQAAETAQMQAQKTFGPASLIYARSAFSYAKVFHVMGDYTAAEPLYLEVKDIRAKMLGNMSADYAKCLNNLAALYYAKNEYDKAERMYIETLAIWEKLLGKEHPIYAFCLSNLASNYTKRGKYDESIRLNREVKYIREKTVGKEHIEYALVLINMGNAYSLEDNYDEAVNLYQEAITIQKKLSRTMHPNYASNLSNLATVLTKKGDYEQAIKLYLEAQTILEKTVGIEHQDYAVNRSMMARTYVELGAYEKAVQQFLEAKTLLAHKLGTKHLEYINNIDNLGNLYYDNKEYDKAIAIYQEILPIREALLGKEHSDYAVTLHNLACAYTGKGEYEQALPLYLESQTIWGKNVGKTSLTYAVNLSAMSIYYRYLADYEQALKYHFEGQSIIEKALGKEHPRYAVSLDNLAILYHEKGDYKETARSYMASNMASKSLIQKSARYSSEREMLQYQATFKGRFDNMLQFMQDYPNDSLTASAYDNALFLNNALLFSAAAREQSISKADSATRAIHAAWKSCHFQLAKQYALPKSDRDSARVAELEEQANDYEKELARRAPDFVKSQQTVRWQDLKKQLKPGEAALEFVHYNIKIKDKKTDSTFYAALLIRPEWSQPRMVKLFEQHEIQPLLAAANTAASAGQLYASRGVQNGQKNTRGNQGQGIVIPGQKSANLYQLSWAPIDSLLKDCKTVYYAPSGLLHRLNLGAIAVPGTDQTLADRYQLVQLGSTRQLIGHERNSTANTQTATLFGGLRYDADAPVANADSTDQTLAAYDVATLRSTLGGRGGDAWIYLPGTEKEVKNAGSALKNAGFAVQTFSGNQGTEAAFKTLGQHENPAPTVLHIATHGFFFPDPKDSTNRNALRADREPVFKTSDNPLLRSGLILAGANPAWAGTRAPEAQEDGILTAYEISQMNLRGTELVVLSACETGLGDVEDNEGVYGLKRAFKIAGARYLIMSLWQVPDKQTQELMSAFYKNWLEQKMDIPAAFAAAQKSMRKRYSDPFFWAGFVLVE